MTTPPPSGVPSYPQPAKTNGLAIGGFVTSLVCCAPVGLALSIVALNQINKDPRQGGKGLAVAGIVLGGLGVVGGIIYFIAMAGSTTY